MILKSNKVLAVVLIITATVLLTAAGIYCGSFLAGVSGDRYITVFQNQLGILTPRVTSNTIITKQKVFACKDIEVITKEMAAENLRGLNRQELIERFPPERWEVTFTDPNSLVLTEKTDQLCSKHKNYRHLGIFQDRLAVYEGPLGYNEKVIRVESILVTSLPLELQMKLQQAMNFQKQAGVAIEKLRYDLEFATEEALDAALENIDEHGLE
jgi:hypothetical protein